MVTTVRHVEEICTSLPRAQLGFPFGADAAVWKVDGRIFAIVMLRREPPWLNLKCDPDLAEQLRVSYPAIRPGWHMNKRHWNTLVLDGTLPGTMVRELVEDSYDLVVAISSRRRSRS